MLENLPAGKFGPYPENFPMVSTLVGQHPTPVDRAKRVAGFLNLNHQPSDKKVVNRLNRMKKSPLVP